MTVGVLVTNGGQHPPEKLAGASTQRFLDDFGENAPSVAYGEIMRIRDQIEKILTEHHRLVQESERSSLGTEGPKRLASPIDTVPFVNDAVDDILALTKRQEWPTLGKYFGRPETRQYFVEVLHREFHHNMHIERSWHADGQPDHPNSKAFHAALRGEVDPLHPVALAMLPHVKSE